MSGKKKELLIDNYAFVAIKPQLTESSDGSGDYIIEGEFGMVDKKNANNRIYPREIMEREIKSFNERLGGRGVLGELDHPEDGKTKLVRSSHVIEKLWLDENGKIMGRARVVPTAKGKDLLALYQSKAPVGISSRGYGSTMTTEEGVDVVQPDFELKTFDFVEDPSAGVYPELVAESRSEDGKVVIEELSVEEQEKAKKKFGLKNEAVLDKDGDNHEGEDESQPEKDSEDKTELEKNAESESEEAKDVEDSQSDTSAEMSSKMDDEEEQKEGSEEGDSEAKKDEKVENAKAHLNVILNKIEEAKAQLENVKKEKGGDAVLEAIKELVSPLVVENDQSNKIKELEEQVATLEESNRVLREENEVHLTRNRKLAESLDRTVRKLYLEQTLNEIGLHNQEVFYEHFEEKSYETIKDFKVGLQEAKDKIKTVYGENYLSHEDMVENVSNMVEKGKDLEEEVKTLTEDKKKLNESLLFEQRKQTVRKDLESKGLLEGYTNKDEIIEMVAKNEKGNLLEAKKIIKESGVAFKKVPDYTNESKGLRDRLKSFNSQSLEEELDAPNMLNESENGVNLKEFNKLSGIN